MDKDPLSDEMPDKAQSAPFGEPNKRFATPHGARMEDGECSSYFFSTTNYVLQGV
ncbi:hypothetical protein [Rhodoferax sp.]|uniref:hypothetical protein n=1 Tax=Rhodoferax sp. TaxID=50421 RepID=UPI0025F950D3|nr:hypothetical protein [Rhodoferax sp.]MBU3996316.1 hypothetical protein [Gammaproteobacteria bacterium]MBU4170916.1 hypothetical protein [Gammaproteobacteria bacterium]